MWLDDARLVVGVDRERRTVLAVVDIDDAWPVRWPLAGARLRQCRRVARPHAAGATPVFHHDDLNCTSLHVVDVRQRAT